MAKIKIGPIMILIGLGIALFAGGTTILAFAPWWVWAVILFILVYSIGGKRK